MQPTMKYPPQTAALRTSLILFLSSLAWAQLATGPLRADSATEHLPRLAVVTAVADSNEPDRQNVEDLLAIELGHQPFLELIDRQALQAVMKEHVIALANQADTKDALALGKFAGADYLLYVLIVQDKVQRTQRTASIRLIELSTGQAKVDQQVPVGENLALSMAAVREKVLASLRPDSQAANRLTVGIAQFANHSVTGRSDKLGIELQQAIRKRLAGQSWAVVLEREYPTVLLNELELARTGLVRSNVAETLPPADLVISGSMLDATQVYEPDKPWTVKLDLNLRLRGETSQLSQTLQSDAINAAADQIVQKINQFRHQPASPTTVPEKELWRRQAWYLMPKRYSATSVGLYPQFPQMSPLNQRELVRAWENVLLLDSNDPEALVGLGLCQIAFARVPQHPYQWNADQCVAGSRLIERALAGEPGGDRAATYYHCLQHFVSEQISPQRAREMAQYILDHPKTFEGMNDTASIKVALTRPAPTDAAKLAKLQAALANAGKDPEAALILFRPELTRQGPIATYASLLAPYLDSPEPVAQFAARGAMGELLCWRAKDPAALEHFDKAIAVMEAARQKCPKSDFQYTFDKIYQQRIDACQYLGLPDEARKTAWAGARHFLKVGRFDNGYPSYVGSLYEFCIQNPLGPGLQKEMLAMCDAYIGGAKDRWQLHDGWPQVCAKREELLARLAGKPVPDMRGLQLVMGMNSSFRPSGGELVAMRMTAAAGKLWFIPLGKYGDNYGVVYDPARNTVSRLGQYHVHSVCATTDTVFFGGYSGLDAFDGNGHLLKHYDAKNGLFPGTEVYGLCAGGGKIYVAFRDPPQAAIAVLEPATGRVSILAPSSKDAKAEQEPIEPMRRLQWDPVTPRLYAAAYDISYLTNRLLELSKFYAWSPQERTWRRYRLEEAPRFVVSDGSETLEVRILGQKSEFHFVKANQSVAAAVPLPGLMGEPAWDRQHIWAPTASGLYEVDRTSGILRWLAYDEDNPLLSVLKTGDRLYVAARRGLYCYGAPRDMQPAVAMVLDAQLHSPKAPAPTIPTQSAGKPQAPPAGPPVGVPTSPVVEREKHPPTGSGSAKPADSNYRHGGTCWYSAGPGWQALGEVAKAHGDYLASRNHRAEHYQAILRESRPDSTIVLLFALDHDDKNVPPEYADLLAIPWPQVETSLKKGETVEASKDARGRKILLLAAPTVSQLTTLIRQSRLLAAVSPGK